MIFLSRTKLGYLVMRGEDFYFLSMSFSNQFISTRYSEAIRRKITKNYIPLRNAVKLKNLISFHYDKCENKKHFFNDNLIKLL